MQSSSKTASFGQRLVALEQEHSDLALVDGSRVAVIGGGPSGSFFTYFLLKMARSLGTELEVDIFESRSFTDRGPAGCNHCGGIVSESLVQILATEGINIPPSVIQRGIESYVLHMDVGTVRIQPPLQEKRIAAVYRGGGPRGVQDLEWDSFDRYLQGLAVDKGARVINELVTDMAMIDGRPEVITQEGGGRRYDLVVGAAGVNSNLIPLFAKLNPKYKPPKGAKTFICEFHLGRDVIREQLGPSMHVFLLDLPRLEFAAIVPKGTCVTLCLLGKGIDEELVASFLSAPEVRACFPASEELLKNVCHCFPRINVVGAVQPFGDRMVMIGDCGVTRLFKDGIGAAFRTAKAAASAAVLHGISRQDFESHYWPACRKIANDNAIGKIIFAFSHQIQRVRFTRRGVLRMTALEQQKVGAVQHMSTVLWDVFTGSAPYKEVFVRTLHPAFIGGLIWNLTLGLLGYTYKPNGKGDSNGQ